MASSRRRTERSLGALMSSAFVALATGLILGGMLSGTISLAQAPTSPVPTPPAAQPTTPRAPDGKPDLTGIWIPGARGGGVSRYDEQGGETVFAARDNSFENFENDNALRRLGDRNTLRWVATVDDPEVLLEPWTMNPVTRVLDARPGAFVAEDLPCEERDLQHMVTKVR